MNLNRKLMRTIIGITVASLVALPALAGKDDFVVVRCKGKVRKGESSTFNNERGQLSPLKKLTKQDHLFVFPGSSVTVMKFSDCSKMTISVPSGDQLFTCPILNLEALTDKHVRREVSNEFKAVQMESTAYQSKIGGASNRALSSEGFQIFTDSQAPTAVVNITADRVKSQGQFQMQTTAEDGKKVSGRPWVPCTVSVHAAEDGKHSVLTFPGLRLKPGQAVELCQSSKPITAETSAWLRIARYGNDAVEKFGKLTPPKTVEAALEQVYLYSGAELYERAFERSAQFAKQFPNAELWNSVQQNLVEVRDGGQKPHL